MPSSTQPSYNPSHDFAPDGRDIFAMNEHTSPVFETDAEMAKFLGVEVKDVVQFGRRAWMPGALAKWRYQCADAMVKARQT